MLAKARKHVLSTAIVLALGTAGSASAQQFLYQNFDTEPGVGCTLFPSGPGTYPYPAGWLKFNVDGRTPAASVSYVNEAWEVREDFQMDSSNCAAFSTSWYTPAGAANDWTWSPAIVLPKGSSALSWRARAYDPAYRDGYEVRIKTGDAPTQTNQATSTVVFSTPAEVSGAWANRSIPLSTYEGETIYVGFRNNSTDKFLLVIDDVKVMDEAPNLLAVKSSHSSDYPRAPSGQSVPSTLGVTARNESAGALTNINATATIKRDGVAIGSPLLSTPIATMAAGASADIEFPIGYTFNADGSWTIEYQLTANETPSETSILDNVIESNATLIGGVELARYEGMPSGTLGIGAQNGGELGTRFALTQATSFDGVRFALSGASAPEPGNPVWEGQTVVANLRGWDAVANKPGEIIATTQGITSTVEGGVYNVAFTTGPQTLDPGSYVVTLVEPIGGAAMPLFQFNERFKASTQWVIWPTIPGGTWTPAENFGANFAKAFAISLISEFPLFADGFDGTDAMRSRAPAMAPAQPLRRKPSTQLAEPSKQ